jgi:hypothetical protein
MAVPPPSLGAVLGSEFEFRTPDRRHIPDCDWDIDSELNDVGDSALAASQHRPSSSIPHAGSPSRT